MIFARALAEWTRGSLARKLELVRPEPLCLLVLVAFTGCDGATTHAGPGESCFRSTECAPGLACVMGACSDDLGPLVDNGMVPVPAADSGPAPDGAASPDAGGSMDAGPGEPDAGGAVDAGPMITDAGPLPVDAGPVPVDAGPVPVDAGPLPVDGGL